MTHLLVILIIAGSVVLIGLLVRFWFLLGELKRRTEQMEAECIRLLDECDKIDQAIMDTQKTIRYD